MKRPPFNRKDYTLLTFDNFTNNQLLQVLTDVFAVVDPHDRSVSSVPAEIPRRTTFSLVAQNRHSRRRTGENSGAAHEHVEDVGLSAEVGRRRVRSDERAERKKANRLSIFRNTFRQNLVLGDKSVVFPILQWLLEKLPEHRERAYLGRYLSKIEIPSEFLSDPEIAEQYDRVTNDEIRLVRRSIRLFSSSTTS